MTDKNEQYVICEGKKVFVDNGRLDIDYNVESFTEIEGLNNLKNLKHLRAGAMYSLKRIEILYRGTTNFSTFPGSANCITTSYLKSL
ncbi:hypothetical protein LCGC14_1439880 [marine sediment metagenome]|uniref:Uncharacterized protein n=1 Tax=marine sediment metagenome TaxID=412755 RepID=A0A0F9K765_9ZZZZ|nr:hypothetical protein [archaeon]